MTESFDQTYETIQEAFTKCGGQAGFLRQVLGSFTTVVQGHEEKVSRRERLSSVIILQVIRPTSERVVCTLHTHTPIELGVWRPYQCEEDGGQEFCSIIISGPI